MTVFMEQILRDGVKSFSWFSVRRRRRTLNEKALLERRHFEHVDGVELRALLAAAAGGDRQCFLIGRERHAECRAQGQSLTHEHLAGLRVPDGEEALILRRIAETDQLAVL